MNCVEIDSLSKRYRLGTIGYGTLSADLQSWWARLRGREDPNQRIDALGNSASVQESKVSEILALNHVTFNVAQGEVIGIIGRNGAGKSTLLKILSRITAPTAGEVRIRGRIASLLEVGTGFHPELTGRENTYLNGALLGMSKAEVSKKLDDIVSFAGVEKFMDTPVKRYSSGMYVRLAFAIAAHLEPEILIVDEVLAVGDAEFQRRCIGKMDSVAKTGRTIFFVSHNMQAVLQLCSRVVWIDAGKVRADGEPENTVNQYNSFASLSGSFSAESDLVAIEGARLIGGKSEAINSIAVGGPLDIEIMVRPKKPLLNPKLKIQIMDGHRQWLSANMLLDGTKLGSLTERTTLRCVFPNVPLLPRQYMIQISMRNAYGNEYILNPAELLPFTVDGANLPDSIDEAYSHKLAPLVIPYTWHFPDGSHRHISLTH